MATAPPTDPRIGRGAEEDVRPVVAVPSAGMPWWMIAIGIGVAAILLFSVLDLRRRSLSAPTTRPQAADNLGGAAPQPAPLYVPPAPAPTPIATPTPAPPPPPPRFVPPPPQPRIIYVPQPAPPMPQPIQPPPRLAGTGGPVLVVDTTAGDAVAEADGAAGAPAAGGGAGAGAVAATGGSARASVMRHRPTTVPQGTLIPAVLETALDSTRPGLARALVQSDVRGFDGNRVLIQRGSRLIGEYRADLQPGQNRAMVMWTRLVRPDGVTIALGSPAADPLGRVGIKGKVNSHFFEKFGAAILQTALDVGSNYASRLGGSSVIVSLPGSVVNSAAAPLTSGTQIQPTLRVKQGTAITVFVARDLDFTAVESRK